jgi:hypothetical protein
MPCTAKRRRRRLLAARKLPTDNAFFTEFPDAMPPMNVTSVQATMKGKHIILRHIARKLAEARRVEKKRI